MSKLINVASFKFRTDTQSPWQELILTGKVDPLNGVPAGGTAGQILAKASATDYDTVWINDGLTILSYGNSTWADFIAVYTAQKVVYCRASSNSNPASGSQTRLAFMAYVNNAANPTEVEFQYYRSVATHSASQQGDQVFVYKLTKTGGWTVTTREAASKIVAGTGLGSSYSNGTLTLTNSLVQDVDDLKTSIIQASGYAVTGNGTSGQLSLTGLTADHVVGNWGMFSDSAYTTPIPENAPTCDLQITTYSGYWTYTVANFTSTFYLKPTFIKD